MQRSGTEAIRTQIQPSKPKRGIIGKIQREHMVNRVSSYLGRPVSELIGTPKDRFSHDAAYSSAASVPLSPSA